MAAVSHRIFTSFPVSANSPRKNSLSVSSAAPPSVTSPPEESVEAARGAVVTFTCEAVGVPVPIITWRLNWGHIPASARCHC